MNSYCYKTRIPIYFTFDYSPQLKFQSCHPLALAEKVWNKTTLERFLPIIKEVKVCFTFVRSYYVGLVSISWYTSLNKKHGQSTSRHLHACARNLYVQHRLFGTILGLRHWHLHKVSWKFQKLHLTPKKKRSFGPDPNLQSWRSNIGTRTLAAHLARLPKNPKHTSYWTEAKQRPGSGFL